MSVERDSNNRPVPHNLARTLSAALLFAAGCSPGIPEPESPDSPPGRSGVSRGGLEDCKIPAHIRGILTEAIAQATEVACLPTPTPEKGFKEPQVTDIKVERELFAKCAPGRDDLKGDDMWGGWIVRFDNPNYYLRGGKFDMDLRTPSGSIIATHPLPPIKLAPAATDYIPAFIEPAPKHKAMFGSRANMVLSGKGSQLGMVSLRMGGRMEWARIDDSPREYKWEADFTGTGFIANSFNYTTALGRRYLYPGGTAPRSFFVNFANNSERAINQLGIFGFALDSQGLLADMFMRTVTKIPYGESQTFQVGSLSDGGRCASLEQSNLELLWWTAFETHTGMPVVKHERVKIPHW